MTDVPFAERLVLQTAEKTRAKNADEKGDTQTTEKWFQAVCDMIAGALRNGHAQPWMYHGYALALEATGADEAEVERAMLSAADFAGSPDELLNVARHMSHAGLRPGFGPGLHHSVRVLLSELLDRHGRPAI